MLPETVFEIFIGCYDQAKCLVILVFGYRLEQFLSYNTMVILNCGYSRKCHGLVSLDKIHARALF